MESGIIAGDVTGLAKQLLRLDFFPVAHKHAGSNRASIRLASDEFDLKPMLVRGGIIAHEGRGLVAIHDDDVQIAVIVEVSEGATAAGVQCSHSWASFVAQLFKPPIPQIAKNNARALVRKLRKGFLYVGVDVSCNQKDVRVAIIIKVHDSCTPANKTSFFADAGRQGHVIKLGLA